MKKLQHTLVATLLLIGLHQCEIQASGQLSELPSEETLQEITQSYSPDRHSRNWWEEGPPGQGGGGGGAVGIPLGDGMVPLTLGGLGYLIIVGVRRRKTRRGITKISLP